MLLSNKFLVVTTVGLLSLLCGVARADGLGDLKAALVRLQGQAPLKASIEAKYVAAGFAATITVNS